MPALIIDFVLRTEMGWLHGSYRTPAKRTDLQAVAAWLFVAVWQGSE